MADHTQLLCVSCAGKDQKKDISTMDKTGMRIDDLGQRTDQIGWLVPAVPTDEGTTFWGYTSVPQDKVDWWQDLPL
jgi:hypothetical protein